MMVCFLVFKEMSEFPNLIQYPVSNSLDIGRGAQPKTQYAVNSSLLFDDIKVPIPVPLLHISIPSLQLPDETF